MYNFDIAFKSRKTNLDSCEIESNFHFFGVENRDNLRFTVKSSKTCSYLRYFVLSTGNLLDNNLSF